MTAPLPPDGTTGARAFVRTALFAALALAFVGLAVATVMLDGPWTVVVAYVACAVVLALLSHKVFPRRSPVTPKPGTRTSGAKRSGNPAVRAESQSDPRRGSDSSNR